MTSNRGETSTRAARERRVLIALNGVLLIVTLAIALPAGARGLMKGTSELRECASMRNLLAARQVLDFQRNVSVELDEATAAALKELRAKLGAEKFVALPVGSLIKSLEDVFAAQTARSRARAHQQNAVTANQALLQLGADVVPEALQRIIAFKTTCETDPSASEDCRTLGTLPVISFSETKTLDDIERRCAELEALHRAESQLVLRHPQLKLMVAADLEVQERAIRLARDLVKAIEVEQDDQSSDADNQQQLSATEAALRQKLEGVRLYCNFDASNDRSTTP